MIHGLQLNETGTRKQEKRFYIKSFAIVYDDIFHILGIYIMWVKADPTNPFWSNLGIGRKL